MEFLGYKVGNGQTTIPDTRAKALLSYTKPTTKRDLRSILRAVSFYRRYIEQLVIDTATPSPATSKVAPAKVEWTREMELAFHHLCESVSKSCILTIPLPEDAMSIVTKIGSSCILLPADQGP